MNGLIDRFRVADIAAATGWCFRLIRVAMHCPAIAACSDERDPKYPRAAQLNSKS